MVGIADPQIELFMTSILMRNFSLMQCVAARSQFNAAATTTLLHFGSLRLRHCDPSATFHPHCQNLFNQSVCRENLTNPAQIRPG